MSVRVFLHFRQGRDDNMLTWEAQDEAAARKIGSPAASIWMRPPGWMRVYFRHARAVHRVSMPARGDPGARDLLSTAIFRIALAAFER